MWSCSTDIYDHLEIAQKLIDICGLKRFWNVITTFVFLSLYLLMYLILCESKLLVWQGPNTHKYTPLLLSTISQIPKWLLSSSFSASIKRYLTLFSQIAFSSQIVINSLTWVLFQKRLFSELSKFTNVILLYCCSIFLRLKIMFHFYRSLNETTSTFFVC